MFKVVLIKGDGIGPEIADAVVEIFEAAKVPITWIEHQAGLNMIDKNPSGIPKETMDAIKQYEVALKGPTTTPIGKGHKSVNVTLRTSLELYANVRATKSLPGVRTRFDNIDLIIFRENIEDTYSGIEHNQTASAGGGAPVYRRTNVAPKGVPGYDVLTGSGTQAQPDAATVTPSADGATITVAALAAGFVLASASAHLPDGFTSASTSAFSFVRPANFGVNALDSLPIVDLVRFNAAGMRQAQTNLGVSVTGTAVTVTQTGLTGGVAARFKATAL